MSLKLKYHQAFSAVVVNALLHVLMQRAQSSRFMPTKRCNELLIKHLKGVLDRPEYALCKKEIKVMISLARKGGDLCARLFELNQLNQEYQAAFSQADELYILFHTLKEHHDYASQIGCEGDGGWEPNTLYMTQEEIASGFDDDNRQVNALTFWAKTINPQDIVNAVATVSPFFATVERRDEDGVTYFRLERH